MQMQRIVRVQGYLVHKKTPTPLGPPQDPAHGPTGGSQEGAFSYDRGTPVLCTFISANMAAVYAPPQRLRLVMREVFHPHGRHGNNPKQAVFE